MVSTFGTLTLPNVELGNNERINTGRQEAQSYDGDLLTTYNDAWPINYFLEYSMTKLCPEEYTTIVEYLEGSLGQAIVLTDHTGVDWDVILTSPNSEESLGINRSITLQFEGTKV